MRILRLPVHLRITPNLLHLLLLYTTLADKVTERPYVTEGESSYSSDYILTFQSDGIMSNSTWAAYNVGSNHQKALPSSTVNHEKTTICYWFNIHFHHSTISMASFCGPALNCSKLLEGTHPQCSNIQYHVEKKRSDVLRVEFSISHVKTKSLRASIKPKQWNHHCFIYKRESGEITVYSNGERESHAHLKKVPFQPAAGQSSSPPWFPKKGMFIIGQEQEQLCGGFDNYDSLSADVSQFQVWDRALHADEIRNLAKCWSNKQGNIFSWADTRDKWDLSNVEMRHLQYNEKTSMEFCTKHNYDYHLVAFTERRTIEMADYTCKVHGGRLPVPKNSYENKKMAELGMLYVSVCSTTGKDNIVQPYSWLGIEDPDGKGKWRDIISKKQIDFENWDKDEGSEGDTCARMQGNGVWRDTVCKKSDQHCTICQIADPYKPFKLRGICSESNIDRDFFLMTGKFSNLTGPAGLKPIYEGYFSKIFWKENERDPDLYYDEPQYNLRSKDGQIPGHWELLSRIANSNEEYHGSTNATSQVGYPVGRHLWLITDPKCDLFTPTWLNLTLSRCEEDEFTCDDGLCIPSWQRCDLVQNCEDLSDELNCRTVIVPETYLLNPPTDPANPDEPVTIRLSLSILTIDKINTAQMMFALTMMVSLEWTDPRLKFKNLKPGSGHNRLSEEEITKIWKPDVSLVNAKIGQLKANSLGVMVQRDSEPLPFSYETAIEDKIYLGSENPLVMTTKMYVEYGCTFDLRSFPFDNQKCAMNFSMDSAKAKYIILSPDEIKYQGDFFLLEFFVKNISSKLPVAVNENGHSVVTVLIEFHRELGNMVNTYFQTFLLCLMAYLTLYINLADFGNRFMGALTSLLVLASLLASIEENLPKTSYFKKIDIWFMSYIIFIFVIIVFHICVDFWIKHDDQVIENSHTHIMARKKRLGATYLNNIGKIVFPICLTVFTLLYFVLSFI